MKYGQRAYAPPVNNDTEKCKRCKFYLDDALFELCTHPSSEYKVGEDRPSHHTIAHMRTWECGDMAANFSA